MATWASKDPDAVLDYVYRIPLDAGDSVASHTLTKLSGTVVIDSESLAAAPDTTATGYGQALTVWVKAGTDGETNVFRIGWVTTLGRTDDDIITLAVSAHEIDALVLTGYVKPLPGHLLARYPAFAGVATSTIKAWLTDAERFVTTSWAEGDYAAGLMSLAAHNLAMAGFGTDARLSGVIPAGVSRFKSGSLDVTLTDAAADARLTGGYGSTRYGAEYELLLRRNRGGPYVQPTGVCPDYAPFGVGWPW